MSRVPDTNIEASLRREAAIWVARMQGPDAHRHQDHLDQWLAADPRHVGAYSRASQRFDDARILAASDIYRRSTWPRPGGQNRLLDVCLALLLAALAAALLVLVFDRHRDTARTQRFASHSASHRPLSARFASGFGEIHRIRLVDGSVLTLDTNSVVRVVFGATRQLFLERGRARFAVSHDGRLFIVHAAGGTITARGTLFDVALKGQGGADIFLIQGAVDVAGPLVASHAVTKRLLAGQTFGYTGHGEASPVALPVMETAWPDGMADFDAAPLSVIIERANRYAVTPLRLADPGLGLLQASGRFRINDSHRLAANLAKLLDLQVDETTPGAILLRRD